MTSSERPQLNHRLPEELVTDKSIVNVFRSVSFDTSFEVDLPCGFLCNLSSRNCDRVGRPFLI